MNNKIITVLFAVFLTVGFNVSGAVNYDDSGNPVVIVKNHTAGDNDKNNGQIPGQGHAPGCPCNHCKDVNNDVELAGVNGTRPVSPAIEPHSIGMQNTGVDWLPIGIAILLILVGLLVARRRV